MDGAYIPDDHILAEMTKKNYYTNETIETCNHDIMIERNHQKQEILNKMVSLPKVWGSIPYSVYYFSCNLDDVLHNKANMCRDE